MTVATRKRRRRPMKRRSLLVKDHTVIAGIAAGKGLGPVRLARYCEHENHSFMSRLLRGQPQARRVSPKTAALLAEALGVEVHILFADEEVKSLDSTRTYLPRPRRAA